MFLMQVEEIKVPIAAGSLIHGIPICHASKEWTGVFCERMEGWTIDYNSKDLLLSQSSFCWNRLVHSVLLHSQQLQPRSMAARTLTVRLFSDLPCSKLSSVAASRTFQFSN